MKKISFENINKNPKKYAEEFSEGNKDLEECLLKLWENNLHTVGCCIGHGKSMPYICFDLSFNHRKLINILNNIDKNNIRISFVYGNNNNTIGIKSVDINDTSIFKKITKSIKAKIDNKVFNDDINKISKITDRYYSIIYYYKNNNITKKLITTNNLDEINKLKNNCKYFIINEKNNFY